MAKKLFNCIVTETYSKCYTVEAEDYDEAYDKADDMASEDMDLACPENLDNREVDVEEDEE